MSLLRAASLRRMPLRPPPLRWSAPPSALRVALCTRSLCHSHCRQTDAAAPPSAPSPSSAPPSTLLLVDAMGLAFRQYFGYKNRYTPLVANVPDSLGVPPALPASAAAAAPSTDSLSADAASAASPSAASPSGTTSRDVGALYGYASSLLNLCFLLQPSHVAACMDLGNRSSFRHLIFPDYKSERKPVEDALKWQLSQLARVTRALGIQPITAPGFEADDVIGTLARLASSPSPASPSSSAAASAAAPAFDRVIILSNDKDFIQCLNERVSILAPKTGAAASASIAAASSSASSVAGNGPAYVFLHHSEVPDVLGIPPSRFIDYLVLVGDVVDGIPGVAGVGPVRARAILEAYPSLEACVADCKANGGKGMSGGGPGKKAAKPTKSVAKVVESMLHSAPHLALWKELATIRTDVPDLPPAAVTVSADAATAGSVPAGSSSAWDCLAYHGPVAAHSDEVEAITPAQQSVADSIHSVWREFCFPPPPHFVDEPSTAAAAASVASAAAAAASNGFDVPITSDAEPATGSSALPRLLSQSEWSELESVVEARAKVRAARKKANDGSTVAATTAVYAAATSMRG